MAKSRIPSYIAPYLWSYHVSSLGLRQHSKLIITQVLNYGNWRALRWLFRTYPEREIKGVVSHPRRGIWFKNVLNFWCLMFKIALPKRVKKRAIFEIDPKARRL